MTNKSIPTLYVINQNYSSWSLRAWLALRHLDAKFDTVVLKLGTEEYPDFAQSSALLARAGPTLKVPALHVTKPSGENHIVFESLAIMEYLAEEYPQLWPTDKYDRAYARSLASEMATGFGPLRNYAMNLRANYPFNPDFYNQGVEKNINRLSAIWEELRSKAAEDKATDKGYLFGSFTALDAMYAPVMFRLNSYSLLDKVTGAHAMAYIQHMLASPEMQEWVAAAKLEKEIIPSDEMYSTPAPVL
ncbi:hypothetical protein BG004_003726 [Podila humilis]|nr:hypothetical protein BG004_003726 [Podila humilis]